MPQHEHSGRRLFVDASFKQGGRLPLNRSQANYLLNVLRLREGGVVPVFNGRDGEWLAEVIPAGRKSADLLLIEQTRSQTSKSDLHFVFAPLKRTRMEYMVQKAVEMGAGTLQPVVTKYTQHGGINLDKMRVHAIEAAEQSGSLLVPEIEEARPLADFLKSFDPDRVLVFCDEDMEVSSAIGSLSNAKGRKLSVLIGPEGGFSDEERAMLNDKNFVIPISLGPLVLRADTAAVAALALVQAIAGDWGIDS